MTEKTYKGIEAGIVTALGTGVNFVVDKAIIKAVDPQTIPEKIMTGVGIVAVDLAVDYGICKMVHSLMYPNEIKKYEMLVEENIKAIQTNSELAKVMTEHEVKVENAVEDIYRKIMEGTIDG